MSLMMSGDKGISAFPNGDDVFSWIGTIKGPQGTVSKINVKHYDISELIDKKTMSFRFMKV